MSLIPDIVFPAVSDDTSLSSVFLILINKLKDYYCIQSPEVVVVVNFAAICK